jgi:hypothetical protein
MSHDNATGTSVAKDPAHQTGEEHGSIHSAQRTDQNTREKDLPRGSESKVGRKSRHR